MEHFPLFIKIADKPCLIVGAGNVAWRKAQILAEAGAQVKIVAPVISEAVHALSELANVTLLQEAFSETHLEGMELVIAATHIREVNEQIHHAAVARGIPVNVVDTPDLCTFIFPALVERGPITVAVCSNGVAPVLARLIRARIESVLPQGISTLARLAKQYRAKVKQVFSDLNQRRHFWENAFEGKVASLAFAGKDEEAEALLRDQLNNLQPTSSAKGEVYLVGAGPGDPELLTFKALRLMQQADIVLYDRLVSKEILALTRRDAHKIFVGKERANHCVPQSQINQKLVEFAKQGHRVLRLKGGDPYIFGRGGEEAESLVEAGVPFMAVPGITSAAGTSTFCGIPLTHRDYAQSVTFVTGHLKNHECKMDWQAYAKPNQTLVVYMGLSSLQQICEHLIEHGKSANTPIAIIQNATRPDQRVVTGTLSNIQQRVIDAGIQSPALIIIGEVVALRDKLRGNSKKGSEQGLNFALDAYKKEHVA